MEVKNSHNEHGNIQTNEEYKLAHSLGMNDPWAHTRVYDGFSCPTCRTRTWLKEEKLVVRNAKEKLLDLLLQKTGSMCRQEGSASPASPKGKKTLYRGLSSQSACQRHHEHHSDVENSTASSPLVQHSNLEHRGCKPQVIYLIDKIEPKALYRAIKEAVKILNMPEGPMCMNMCSEWGVPRVPILTVLGGDQLHREAPGVHNPHLNWSREMMEKIEEGSNKRIEYWDADVKADINVNEQQLQLQEEGVSPVWTSIRVPGQGRERGEVHHHHYPLVLHHHHHQMSYNLSSHHQVSYHLSSHHQPYQPHPSPPPPLVGLLPHHHQQSHHHHSHH